MREKDGNGCADICTMTTPDDCIQPASSHHTSTPLMFRKDCYAEKKDRKFIVYSVSYLVFILYFLARILYDAVPERCRSRVGSTGFGRWHDSIRMGSVRNRHRDVSVFYVFLWLVYSAISADICNCAFHPKKKTKTQCCLTRLQSAIKNTDGYDFKFFRKGDV